MPGHDGSRKRRAWRAPKRVRVAKAASPVQSEPITTTYDYGNTLTTTVDVLGSLRQIALTLWSSDYKELMKCEQQALDDEGGQVEGALNLMKSFQQSTYTRRGLSRRKEQRALLQERFASGWAAAARRLANQKKHSFTICARSLIALARKLPQKEWRRQTMSKLLLARQTTIKLLYHTS